VRPVGRTCPIGPEGRAYCSWPGAAGRPAGKPGGGGNAPSSHYVPCASGGMAGVGGTAGADDEDAGLSDVVMTRLPGGTVGADRRRRRR
jgi:hypothetical protein